MTDQRVLNLTNEINVSDSQESAYSGNRKNDFGTKTTQAPSVLYSHSQQLAV